MNVDTNGVFSSGESSNISSIRSSWLRYLFVLTIFLFALGLRIAYVNELEIENPYRADAGKYCRLAYNLAVKHVYTQDRNPPYSIETSITPGYPLFLALVMAQSKKIDLMYNRTLILQAILSAATVALSYLLFCRYLSV
jgi:hypothetical protein